VDSYTSVSARNRITRLVVGYLFLLVLLPWRLVSQELLINPELPRVGDRFILSFDLPTASLQGFSLQGLQFPREWTPLTGPDLNRIPPPRLSTQSPGTRVAYSLRAREAGWYTIPEFSVQVAGEVYNFPQFLVPIRLGGNDVRVPPHLEWKIPNQSIVAGQSTPVYLELSFMEGYVLPESLNFGSQSQGVLEEVSGLGSAITETIGGREFNRYTVASFILTPEAAGPLLLPETQIQVEGMDARSQEISLEILPAPLEIRTSGAVGNFTLSGTPSTNEVRVGDLVRYVVRLEGEGNLNFARIPEPLVRGGRISSQTEVFRVNPSSNGWRGFREITYRIVSEREGTMDIELPTFRFYDPLVRGFSTLPASVKNIRVGPGVISNSPVGGGLELVAVRDLPDYDLLELYRRPESYFLLIPPVFLGLGLVINRGRRSFERLGTPGTSLIVFLSLSLIVVLTGFSLPQSESHRRVLQTLTQAQDLFLQQEYEQSLALMKEIKDEYPYYNPGLLHNQGLVYLALEQESMAVFHLRQARRALPADNRLYTALLRVEDSLGLERQHSIPVLPPGDLFFLVFLGLWYLGFLMTPFWFANREIFRRIFFIFFVIMLVTPLVGLGLYLGNRYQSEGIVLESEFAGQVTKIPEPNAALWLTLPRGTSVEILDVSGDFSLIQTSYGIEGWLLTEGLGLPGQL